MENQHPHEHETETKVPEVQAPAQLNNLSIPIAIVIAGALIAGAVYLGTSKSSTTAGVNNNQPQQVAQQPSGQAVDISKVKTAGDPFVGDPNAKVTIAYWFDYQCPFCKRFDEDAIVQIMNDYVKTGKVKIVFKDFQFLGADSQTAGLAERAVWDVAPDKFYAWHKAMYDKQDSENSGWGNKADILALTKSVGIDSAKVEQLMTSKATEYQKAMDADKAEGGAFGINGTPGTIIGKNLISGAQPYAAVKQLIDLALQGK
jgi:protein-disulfide isomerase